MAEEPRTTLADGTQVYPEHRTIITEGPRKGQQQDYVVLAEEERAKGFVRPVRRSYLHLKCGCVTTMGLTLAETYARDPSFYSGTFCVGCGVVAQNLEAGNIQVLAGLSNTRGRA